MMPIAFDFETCLIRPGLQYPPPVCLSVYDGSDALVTPPEGFPRLLGEDLLLGLNTAYDLGVALGWLDCAVPLFRALDDGRIIDVGIIERIAEISGLTTRKELSLATIHEAHGLGKLEKPAVRTDYGRYYGRFNELPQAHLDYARDDAVATYRVYERQYERWISKERVYLEDAAHLTRKQFWLGLSRAWGLRADAGRVDQLEAKAVEHVERLRAFAQEHSLVRADGSRDMKAIKALVTEAYDGNPPMTEAPKGKKGAERKEKVAAGKAKPFVPQVKTSSDVLRDSGHPVLEHLAEFGEWQSTLNKDVALFRAAGTYPVHTKYGIADTTRTTSAKPNIQNFSRGGGVRECFIPRDGYLYIFIDHSGLELCTLAQMCINYGVGWELADLINNDVDVHCVVGAQLAKVPFEQFDKKKLKDFRQRAKGVNFGAPGGMAARTLIAYTRAGYGVTMSEAEADETLRAWREKVPCGPRYLRSIRRFADGDRYTVPIPGTRILRRRATYCAAANTGFQGLGANVEADVGWAFAKEMYLPTGRMQDCRQVAFIHDEFGFEVPIARVQQVADVIHEIMVTVPRRLLPDVRIKAELAIMPRWLKGAESVRKDGMWTICG